MREQLQVRSGRLREVWGGPGGGENKKYGAPGGGGGKTPPPPPAGPRPYSSHLTVSLPAAPPLPGPQIVNENFRLSILNHLIPRPRPGA